eukprot:comp18724_c0_seq1/m.20487 comp18724_c0_seq1/g.20487  ORF comp18724_c0_seq1/g.20487 comp18724_c0_seq1/m.20487 type:complete len:239 (-) comp18724_c0_seq1:181-897(-)
MAAIIEPRHDSPVGIRLEKDPLSPAPSSSFTGLDSDSEGSGSLNTRPSMRTSRSQDFNPLQSLDAKNNSGSEPLSPNEYRIFRHNSQPDGTGSQKSASASPLDRSRSGSMRKPKKALGWQGFNKQIADPYLNVDGSAAPLTSPALGRRQKQALEMAKITYKEEHLSKMSTLELSKLAAQLAIAINDVTMENTEVLRDQRQIQEDNEKLSHLMAKICDAMNEEILAKSEECLQKSVGQS